MNSSSSVPNDTSHSKQNQDQQHNNQQTDNRGIHRHPYAKCLMCAIGFHEDCVKITTLSMTGKGEKWKYTNICECAINGHI